MAACIVVFDDEQGLCVPFGFSQECDGAFEAACGNTPVAVFPGRAAARKAITISKRYAKLIEAQGGPVNMDFTTDAASIKIKDAKIA